MAQMAQASQLLRDELQQCRAELCAVRRAMAERVPPAAAAATAAPALALSATMSGGQPVDAALDGPTTWPERDAEPLGEAHENAPAAANMATPLRPPGTAPLKMDAGRMSGTEAVASPVFSEHADAESPPALLAALRRREHDAREALRSARSYVDLVGDLRRLIDGQAAELEANRQELAALRAASAAYEADRSGAQAQMHQLTLRIIDLQQYQQRCTDLSDEIARLRRTSASLPIAADTADVLRAEIAQLQLRYACVRAAAALPSSTLADRQTHVRMRHSVSRADFQRAQAEENAESLLAQLEQLQMATAKEPGQHAAPVIVSPDVV